MNARVGSAAEDYLKTIYAITRGGRRASTNEIAGQMGVTPASVTGMIRKLASWQPPLVDYEKHRGVALTQEGERFALEIIRHHRLLETFLHEKLGYSWDEVHDEADRLEHVISEELEDRIAGALGEPSVDPHGDPIPSREFRMPEQSDIRLADLQPGDRAEIVRIYTGNPELLRYLAEIGLTPSARITVVEVFPFDDNLSVRLDDQEQPFVLGSRVTGKIFVEKM